VTFTKKTDIWSFGCALFEVIGRTKPWSDFYEKTRDTTKSDEESKNLFYQRLVKEIYPSMAANKGPSVKEIFKNSNTGEYPALSEVMYKCLELDPEKRLTIEQVIAELKQLIESQEKEKEKDLGIPVGNFNKLASSKTFEVEDGGYFPDLTNSTVPLDESYSESHEAKDIKSSES